MSKKIKGVPEITDANGVPYVSEKEVIEPVEAEKDFIKTENSEETKNKVYVLVNALSFVLSGLLMAKDGFAVFEEQEVLIKTDLRTLDSAKNLIESRLSKLSVLFEPDIMKQLVPFTKNYAMIVKYLSNDSTGTMLQKLDLILGILDGRLITMPKESFIAILRVMNQSTDPVVVDASNTMLGGEVVDFLINEQKNQEKA